MTEYRCSDCKKSLTKDQLVPPDDLPLRVDVGESMIYGQCPDCGALVEREE